MIQDKTRCLSCERITSRRPMPADGGSLSVALAMWRNSTSASLPELRTLALEVPMAWKPWRAGDADGAVAARDAAHRIAS